jgi:hypothetical protein
VKIPVGMCAVCGESIWVDDCDDVDRWDAARFAEEFSVLAADHIRSHPRQALARFCLNRFRDDARPSQRALAVRQVYRELCALSGDEDSHPVYTIDEALGSVSMYRLWLAS